MVSIKTHRILQLAPVRLLMNELITSISCSVTPTSTMLNPAIGSAQQLLQPQTITGALHRLIDPGSQLLLMMSSHGCTTQTPTPLTAKIDTQISKQIIAFESTLKIHRQAKVFNVVTAMHKRTHEGRDEQKGAAVMDLKITAKRAILHLRHTVFLAFVEPSIVRC